MKKLNSKLTICVLLLLTICLLFNSCKKDETYNPERKIKKIYNKYSDGHKYLAQEWTWDNNKLVRIDYYPMNGYDIYKTEYFTYEDEKLVKIQDNNGYYLISYTHSEYDNIDYYRNDDNNLILNCHFTYNNNKVSKIIFTSYDFWYGKMGEGDFLSSLLSKDLISNIEQILLPSTGKSDFPTISTFSYKYDGNNIKEMKWEINEQQSITFIYKSYDKMQNPFYKYLGLMYHLEQYNVKMVASKNNLLEVNIIDSFEPDFLGITKYSYKYDDDFPIEVEAKTTNLPNDGFKTYYEYE